ncbi:MAG: malto-oligosyltrehalose trehalohydrolase [Candidatus Eremiobacteraeota bacterium]|nr:malto-oligosyltrehalose trehalohydrolase [Candidatus Eremiobacteraeota bacterium]
MPFGASVLADGGVRFRLYAPSALRVAVVYATEAGEARADMVRSADGFHETVVTHAAAGTTYRFDIDGLVAPDPASRYQPEGVHGPSLVVDPHAFAWNDDAWRGRSWNEHVFYELHVGTFTPEGTYAAAESKLDYLADLGVTALELMPLADVPGTRNWGYDGVLPYAPSHNYGTPDELKRFVAAAHARNLAVYLDGVYNHFGPEGNYLHAYAPEFYTERHHTPWGAAIDVEADDRQSVRDFFIENAVYWLEEYRFDGLRFDAVHAIYDGPQRRFLRELATTVRARVSRPVHLVLENEENESSLLGESAYRAQWDDDAHHAAHVAVTGQTDGYYSDYSPDTIALLGRTLTQGFAYQNDPSPFRDNRLRGEPSADLPHGSFVTFLQNHDQIGNRPFGDRITSLAPDFAVRAMLGVLLLAPSPPLLFMGEEWGASTPFLFFCDFEPELAQKVTEGRRGEFGTFAEFADPAARARIPDPAAAATFAASKLRWDELEREPHRAWHAYYRRLLAIRRNEIAPRIANANGRYATYEAIGSYGLKARFRLDDGTTLALETNLGNDAAPGFSSHPKGFVLFATHDPTFANTIAPPWSVRWTLE